MTNGRGSHRQRRRSSYSKRQHSTHEWHDRTRRENGSDMPLGGTVRAGDNHSTEEEIDHGEAAGHR